MTYKKFIDNIENIYANQGDKPESERLRYGQIIMNELWKIWPEKYRQITGSDQDPFYSDIIHKKPYDLLRELALEWPVFPDKKDDKTISGTDLIKRICAVIKNIKGSINLTNKKDKYEN